jgi:hypothetical protein
MKNVCSHHNTHIHNRTVVPHLIFITSNNFSFHLTSTSFGDYSNKKKAGGDSPSYKAITTKQCNLPNLTQSCNTCLMDCAATEPTSDVPVNIYATCTVPILGDMAT